MYMSYKELLHLQVCPSTCITSIWKVLHEQYSTCPNCTPSPILKDICSLMCKIAFENNQCEVSFKSRALLVKRSRLNRFLYQPQNDLNKTRTDDSKFLITKLHIIIQTSFSQNNNVKKCLDQMTNSDKDDGPLRFHRFMAKLYTFRNN